MMPMISLGPKRAAKLLRAVSPRTNAVWGGGCHNLVIILPL